MDFNAILEKIYPILGVTGTALLIVLCLAVYIVIKHFLNKNTATIANMSNVAAEAFKKALPKELYISLETIAKEELAKIKTEFTKAVEEKFINQIKANTELVQEIAKALCTLKAIPDSIKEEIAEMLDIEKPETTESLKVELLPTSETETKTETKTETITENKKISNKAVLLD